VIKKRTVICFGPLRRSAALGLATFTARRHSEVRIDRELTSFADHLTGPDGIKLLWLFTPRI
jgi:hypothetical protein